ncbi:MAG: ATP-binding protein [Bacteroidota bacterium]|nr:ATP-binding protein [Bacteroidota bacterium]
MITNRKGFFFSIVDTVLFFPRLMITTIRTSINARLSASYFKIMCRVSLLLFLCTIITLGYYGISNVISYDSVRLNSTIQTSNAESITNNLKSLHYTFSIYDGKNIVYKENSLRDTLFLNYSFPFTIQNNNYYFLISKPISLNNNLLIYYDITDVIYELAYVGAAFIIISTLGILLTTLLGISANGRVLYPIHQMAKAIRKISSSNLSLRINVSDSKNELKELSIAFNKMMDDIEYSYNNQQQFVSDASHELRTPIAVIQGYANMLNRWGKEDPKVMQESIDAISNESENMKDLVEKLLFIVRSDSDRLTLQNEDFDLSELAREIMKETQMIDNNHIFEQNIQNSTLINADRNRIKQALRIIVDNAIKYTPPNGKITINSMVEKNYAIISISDTGVGISKQDIDHIFDRFYRSDKSRTREKGGHGLGLNIAKIIVLKHKGKIKVKSKVDEGTEFRIFLPISNN